MRSRSATGAEPTPRWRAASGRRPPSTAATALAEAPGWARAGWSRSWRAWSPAPGCASSATATAPRPSRPPAAEEDPFGLTPRERQVLALLAEGTTNREIGETLFMAEKTASVHVSRILSKLDVRSRTQAAALAHRLGLERESR